MPGLECCCPESGWQKFSRVPSGAFSETGSDNESWTAGAAMEAGHEMAHPAADQR
jgi:hypothetical protein